MTIAAASFAEIPFASQNIVAVSVTCPPLTLTAGSPSEIVGDSNFPHPIGLGMTVSLGQEIGTVLPVNLDQQITASLTFVANDSLHINSTDLLTGLSLTNTLGSVTIDAQQVQDVTGFLLSATPGSVTVTGTSLQLPTGVSATLTPATITPQGNALPAITGLSGTFVLGSPTIHINQTIIPTGIEITLEALPGSVFTGWHDVTTPTSPSWVNIDSGSGSTWSNINATTSGTWTNVDSSGNSSTWSNVTVPTDSNWTEH
jgi:hypothetical protein